MSRTPVILPAADSELARLVESICDGTIAPAERDRLESLLTDDRDAKLYYVAYLDMHAQMQWITRGEGQEVVDSPAIDAFVGEAVGHPVGAAVEHPVGAAVELPQQLDLDSQIPNPPFPLLTTTHYPPSTSDFVGSWTFACMVATVIVGAMLLGFWAIKITHHQHIATAPSKSVPSDARPERVFVGRITGLFDVKWSADPYYLPPLGYAYVPLGRKYILDSGLMQITYDTGAKVILQGPCTYEVESSSGGYLSLGKLTAKVEAVEGKGSRSKVQGSMSASLTTSHQPLATNSNPQSLIPNPLFAVRTPTAV
ncbi:MAG: hypothetical protein L6306_11850, partial [Planctomycetales bacterium]|nr:hypothetical protein [Planctomycetales bacterium]